MDSFHFGLLWLLLSRFGHDRAKNDSGIKFPSPSCVLPKLSPRFCSSVFSFLPQSYESLVLLCVHSGWYLDYVGVGMKAWFAC